MCIYINT